MPQPLVTISVPVYNVDPDQIKAAVSSALNQTYPAVEIIVVDDGSTRQDTCDAVTALEGVTVLRQGNAGTGAAANAAIRQGSGKYVLNLSADDIISPETVSRLMETLGGSEGVVIAYPRVEKFGTETGVMDAPDEARLEDILIYNCIVTTSLVSRDHWELGGGFDTHRDCSEDWVLWGAILGRTGARAVKSPGAILHYRRTGHTLNVVNRQRQRVRNARYYIAELLPAEKRDVYVSMLTAYHTLEDELISVRADARRWRKFAPVLDPPLRLMRHWRRFTTTSRILGA